MTVLEVSNGHFSYGSRSIFSGINLKLREGEIVILFGPNGCGKTTLLDCILGIHSLEEGEIRVYGKTIADYRPHELARRMAYVPQIHERTFPYLVREVVLMGRTAYITPFSGPSREDHLLAQEALKDVGIESLQDRLYTQLSGGEVQLVMLARALAQRSPIIIMDEPASHLDFRHEIMLLEKIASLARVRGLSFIIATHSPNHAFYFENNGIPTTMAIMNEEKIFALGSPRSVLTEETMMKIFRVESKILSYRQASKKAGAIIALATAADDNDGE
ncbi:MAG: iron ABC transporter ATP-binding protein [Spirochaetae bacterium HGW-Spirochaetae-1]|jgi:iron complex transport system ATP-binding protein|nr:MAG: iron ABC transporter ATP-binding protein [Spirochaetae bacterium HGW-Spirochaetae-1]